MQPDPTLQGEPAQHKAQNQASSSSICKSARILGAHPSLSWPTCLPRGFFASHLCWAGKQHRWERLSQARRSSLTFLSGLLVPNSITPDSLPPLSPRSPRQQRSHCSYSVGEREPGGWVGSGRTGGLGNPPQRPSEGLCPSHARGFAGGCLLLASLLNSPPSTGRGQTFSRFQEEHANLTPASRRLSPVQKYIPTETDS